MTYIELLSWGQKQLSDSGITDAKTDAWLLLEFVTGLNRAAYFLSLKENVSEDTAGCYQKLISRRRERIPLQYLTGEQDFMGLTFAVDESVLIPRQDTETLVELVLPHIRGKRVLDVCTGSGCIAISLQKLGMPALCHAVDISEKALSVAEKNAGNLQADVRFWQSDLFERVTESYDIIVSNPPYIPVDVIPELMPEVREHEPLLALEGGHDGLDFYRRLAAEAGKYLRQDGSLYMEIGCAQGTAVIDLLQRQSYGEIQVYQDMAGKDRVISARNYSDNNVKCVEDL